jgi:hypothetical protein
MTTIKKLYEVPRDTLFKLAEEPQVPPASLEVSEDLGVVYKLYNIDGMYSYCTNVETNEVHHFAAWTQVCVEEQE